MSQFDEAMEELDVPDDASPRRKLAAVCQWVLGDPGWSDQFQSWARRAGYEISEPEESK